MIRNPVEAECLELSQCRVTDSPLRSMSCSIMSEGLSAKNQIWRNRWASLLGAMLNWLGNVWYLLRVLISSFYYRSGVVSLCRNWGLHRYDATTVDQTRTNQLQFLSIPNSIHHHILLYSTFFHPKVGSLRCV
jgi:uncharacterized membrane protein